MKKAGLSILSKNKKMSVDAYLQVLQGHEINFFYIHGCEVFMQDSAP